MTGWTDSLTDTQTCSLIYKDSWFKVPDSKKGSQRLDCLEGMRAISMTWVILGHNFIFGASLLHINGKSFIDQIWMRQRGGLAIEAVKSGQSNLSFKFTFNFTFLPQASSQWTHSCLLELHWCPIFCSRTWTNLMDGSMARVLSECFYSTSTDISASASPMPSQ